MPRKSIGERAMTDAERQARYRAARARHTGSPHAARARSSRPRPALGDAISELTTLQGQYAAWLEACRTTFRTVRPPRHCGRSAISTSLNSRRSYHRAASAGTDPRNVCSPRDHS